MEEFEIYKSLGDPIRLELVKRLSDKQPLTVGELTNDLGVTRQGARKQLQVLLNSGVVKLQPKGRETEVTLEFDTLNKAKDFFSKLEAKWDQQLLSLKNYVESKED